MISDSVNLARYTPKHNIAAETRQRLHVDITTMVYNPVYLYLSIFISDDPPISVIFESIKQNNERNLWSLLCSNILL